MADVLSELRQENSSLKIYQAASFPGWICKGHLLLSKRHFCFGKEGGNNPETNG